MTEQQIIWLWPPHTFRYLRESEIVTDSKRVRFLQDRHAVAGDDTATIGYSVDEAGHTARVWWVFQPTYDGIDPPAQDLKTHPPFKLVEPVIEPNQPSKPWRGIAASLRHPRLIEPPTKLERRWANWQYRHRPRIVRPVGRIIRVGRWIRRGIKHYLRV